MLGIAQANHGSRAALEQMGEADGLVYYSPRTDLDGEPLKQFTAIGRMSTGEGARVLDRDGRELVFKQASYSHF